MKFLKQKIVFISFTLTIIFVLPLVNESDTVKASSIYDDYEDDSWEDDWDDDYEDDLGDDDDYLYWDLSKSKLTLGINETQSLSFVDEYEDEAYSDNYSINWKSSNNKVATVNSKGKVKGISSGSAKITATIKSKVFTCNVTVKKPELSSKNLVINYNSSYTLKVMNYKGKVTWSSSNKKIATVNNNGIVKAKSKKGYTNITAKLDGKTKLTCKVNVKDATYIDVQKTYKKKTVKKNKLWYQDCRYKSQKKGKTVVHNFKKSYNDEILLSLFPNGKYKFAIYNSKDKKVWEKTISKETHVKLKIKKGNYSLKALFVDSNEYNYGYSFRAINNNASFMPIQDAGFDMDSVGGIEPELLIMNNTGKTIKYIDFEAYFYNRVGDPVYWLNKSSESLQIIGPLKKNYCNWVEWDPVFYNSSTHSFKIKTAKITFMDGSTKTINVNKKYYKF